jgi:hypothetical protein
MVELSIWVLFAIRGLGMAKTLVDPLKSYIGFDKGESKDKHSVATFNSKPCKMTKEDLRRAEAMLQSHSASIGSQLGAGIGAAGVGLAGIAGRQSSALYGSSAMSTRPLPMIVSDADGLSDKDLSQLYSKIGRMIRKRKEKGP